MLKQATLYSIMIVLLASCASLKTAFTGTAPASNSTAVKKESKFLDPIDMPVESSKGVKDKEQEKTPAKKETVTNPQ